MVLTATSCNKSLNFTNKVEDSYRSADLDSFSVYVFQVYEQKQAIDSSRKLYNKTYTDGFTKDQGTVVEELYLLFEKNDPYSVYYASTISNQFTQPYSQNSGSDSSKGKKYYGFNAFNSPFHADHILINELDYIRKGKILNDTLSFPNSTLITPNHDGPMLISIERFDHNQTPAIRLIDITNEDTNLNDDSPKMVNIKKTLNLDFVFVKSERKFAYVHPRIDTVAKPLNRIHFGANSVYFSGKKTNLTCNSCGIPYKYVGIRKKRYRE